MTTLRDPRVERYASLLLDTCIRVQPGWQVLVAGSFHGRPLLEELCRQLGRREAYALLRVGLAGGGVGPDLAWGREVPLGMLEHPSEIELDVLQRIDAIVVVEAPENTRQLTALDAERLQASQRGIRPALERVFNDEVPWVGCQWPTPALAQEAGMSTDDFSDFLFGACLLDWGAERERMQHQADRFDAAAQVRIVGEGTDLTLSLAGRTMEVDAGGANMPGGEFFTSPVEDSAEGVIAFTEFPAVYAGREHQGIRLRFEGGRVVDVSADTNEEHLLEMLDSDEGARRLGELGIGCNPGITRHMRNTLFDEKIDGTVHLALGNGFPKLGGTNVSQLHWDIVKDLRQGGRIELDGVVVQENGEWV